MDYKQGTNILERTFIEKFCKDNNITLPVIIVNDDNLSATDKTGKKIKFGPDSKKFLSEKLNKYKADRARIIASDTIIYEINF